jgi:hypothetical protein
MYENFRELMRRTAACSSYLLLLVVSAAIHHIRYCSLISIFLAVFELLDESIRIDLTKN